MIFTMWPIPPELETALADRYSLQSVLGVGGSSTVYRARDNKHQRDVAIKVLRPGLAASLGRQRFARETEIVARLQHPHILSLIDSGTAAETFFFVMPLVEGETLSRRLDDAPPLTVVEATRILSDVADALDYAHQQGVVHRDIKPSNVLLTGRHALLMDFGIAKGATEDAAPLTVGVALGTPAYMAPEQAMALPGVDQRADLYALGVLGYELLAGRPPFAGTPQDVLAAHVSQLPRPLREIRPDVPDALNDIVMRCLEKMPEARWQSASEIVQRLDALVTPSAGITARPDPAVAEVARTWKRPSVLLSAALLPLLGVILVTQRGGIESVPTFAAEKLTFVGNAIESAISPDGRWLAYVAQESTEQALFVRDLGASTALELDRGNEVAGLVWTEDGAEIGYHTRIGAERAVIKAAPRLGGAARVLGRGHGVLSPDLKRIALFSLQSEQIRLVDVGSADTLRVMVPDWVTWTHRVAWSPDSENMVVEVEDRENGLYALLLSVRGTPFVEAVKGSARVSEPSYSRDGRFLYFLRQPAGELPDLMRLELTSEGRPSEDTQLVYPNFEGDARPGFYASAFHNRMTHTAAGEMVYTRTDGESNVYVFDIGEVDVVTEPEPVTTGSAVHTKVRFSPGGERVAFIRTTRIARTIGMMSIAGGPVQTITESLIDGDLAWSETGDRLALTSQRPGTTTTASVFEFSSGTLLPLEIGETSAHVTWSGARLIVQAPGNRSFTIADPDAESTEIVASDTTGFSFYPRVSSDQTHLAYFKRHSTRSGIWIQGLHDRESARLLLGAEVFPLRFNEDGDILFVFTNGQRERDRTVYALSVADGELQPMMHMPPGFVPQDITADGSTLVATRVEWRGDVWRLTPSID